MAHPVLPQHARAVTGIADGEYRTTAALLVPGLSSGGCQRAISPGSSPIARTLSWAAIRVGYRPPMSRPARSLPK